MFCVGQCNASCLGILLKQQPYSLFLEDLVYLKKSL